MRRVTEGFRDDIKMNPGSRRLIGEVLGAAVIGAVPFVLKSVECIGSSSGASEGPSQITRERFVVFAVSSPGALIAAMAGETPKLIANMAVYAGAWYCLRSGPATTRRRLMVAALVVWLLVMIPIAVFG